MSASDATGKTITLDELIDSERKEQVVEFLPLDADLLLKRVKDGGYSGDFLADAFISAYRIDKPFKHGLCGIIKLDHEAIGLFHQILHIRFIPGWNDTYLYDLEQKIKEALL